VYKGLGGNGGKGRVEPKKTDLRKKTFRWGLTAGWTLHREKKLVQGWGGDPHGKKKRRTLKGLGPCRRGGGKKESKGKEKENWQAWWVCL